MKVNMLVKSIVYCKDIRVHGISILSVESVIPVDKVIIHIHIAYHVNLRVMQVYAKD